MTEVKLVPQMVDKAKVRAMCNALVRISEGPREAFGIIAMMVKTFNEELCDAADRVPTEILCDEIAHAINSSRDMDANLQ